MNGAAARSVYMLVHVSQEHMGCCLDNVSKVLLKKIVTVRMQSIAICTAKVRLGKVSNK